MTTQAASSSTFPPIPAAIEAMLRQRGLDLFAPALFDDCPRSVTAPPAPVGLPAALETKEEAMKLYYHPLSGHAHRAQLFLSVAGIPHELIEVDLAAADHKQPTFLALNAFGEIPVLDDSDTIIADSNAILIYIARKIGPSTWLPSDPVSEAEVQRWLSVAAGKIAYGACAARLVTVFGAPFNPAEVIDRAHLTLRVIEATLEERSWIAGTSSPTIADIALYSYVARAPEGNVDISEYPSIRDWLLRVEDLHGFVPFRKTEIGLSIE